MSLLHNPLSGTVEGHILPKGQSLPGFSASSEHAGLAGGG